MTLFLSVGSAVLGVFFFIIIIIYYFNNRQQEMSRFFYVSAMYVMYQTVCLKTGSTANQTDR